MCSHCILFGDGEETQFVPLNGDISFDYLIKVVSASFLHYEFIPFFPLCNKLLFYMVALLRLYAHLISLSTNPPPTRFSHPFCRNKWKNFLSSHLLIYLLLSVQIRGFLIWSMDLICHYYYLFHTQIGPYLISNSSFKGRRGPFNISQGALLELFFTLWCSRLILYFSCLESTNFSRNPRTFHWRVIFGNEDLGTGCAHCYRAYWHSRLS